ncbi:MAG: DUF554 domain-containing protein [Bacilli bacterium]|nr:DUF554 domain-containing protein [Bacilli bacterium]
MRMGTLINGVAIILGGGIGLLLKKGIPERIKNSIIGALGIGVVVVGIVGVVSSMLKVDNGLLSTQGGLILIVSLVLGVFIGELLKLDERLNNLGKKIEKRLGSEGFAKGFINATLFFAVGALAIIGPLTEATTGNYDIMITKSIMDLVSSIILASTLGIGVLFAFIPVVIYQGLIMILATFLNNLLSPALLSSICMVGYTIVTCIGLNFIKVTNFKAVNFIPALFIPVLYEFIMMIFK